MRSSYYLHACDVTATAYGINQTPFRQRTPRIIYDWRWFVSLHWCLVIQRVAIACFQCTLVHIGVYISYTAWILDSSSLDPRSQHTTVDGDNGTGSSWTSSISFPQRDRESLNSNKVRTFLSVAIPGKTQVVPGSLGKLINSSPAVRWAGSRVPVKS